MLYVFRSVEFDQFGMSESMPPEQLPTSSDPRNGLGAP